MIDEMKLIERIQYEYKQWGDEYDALQILGDIEDMPKVGEWIPCSERLPECEWGAETEALMYQVGDSIYTGYFGRGGLHRDNYFRRYTDTTEGVDASDVIAWMPLPEPYKGESE